MKAIYQPKGKAREYSPFALNLYNGCDHRCTYCYVPAIQRKTVKEYSVVAAKKDILEKLTHDLANNKIREQVLMSFSGDPFCAAEVKERIMIRALELLSAAKVPVAVLTKGGKRAMSAFDVFRTFGERIKVGATIVLIDEDMATTFEPGAASIRERIATLGILREAGIRTWISMEPVIYPDQAIQVILETLGVCDEYRIGKINYNPELGKDVDLKFVKDAIRILRDAGKAFYIKKSLQGVCPAGLLSSDETNADLLAVKGELDNETKGGD